MSKIEVNEIVKASGSTLTLGGSGTAVTLGSGATQTGFGRTGAVDWDTTIKTGDFTAENGKGYFVNTTSDVVEITLPASPSAGNIVAIKDYARTFNSNKITVLRNGSNLDGVATNKDFDTIGTSITLIYMDATKGWSLINDDATASIGAAFISASGGNAILTSPCGNYKTHVFTSPGNFVVSSTGNPAGSASIDYLIVAGGGGGGQGAPPAYMGGAGGAGGFRISNSPASGLSAPVMSPLSNPSSVPVSAQSYPIAIGAGGARAPADDQKGTAGSVSSGFSLTSAGGGQGGAGTGPDSVGGPGGSGGGSTSGGSLGNGNTPPVSPPQGNNGSQGYPGNNNGGGGGGGAGAASTQSPTQHLGANGGVGSFLSTSFFGPTAPSYGTPGPVSSTRYFAGGGGGSSCHPAGQPTGGAGGGGRGGTGGSPPSNVLGGDGTANTGGGGGGGSGCGPGGSCQGLAGAGGSGIVAIRYKFQ